MNTSLTQPTLTGYTSGSSIVTVPSSSSIALSNTGNTEDMVYKIVENTGSGRKIVGYGTGDASSITVDGVANVTDMGNQTPGGNYTLYVWAQKDGHINSHEGSDPLCFVLEVGEALHTVTGVFPSGNNVPLGASSLSITFDKAMDTVVPGTVSLNPGATVTGGAWEADNRTVPYDLDDLAYNTIYTVTIEDFKDTSGNMMAPDSNHSFTTESAVATPTDLKVGNMKDDSVAEGENYSKTIPVDYNGSLALGYSASGLPGGLSVNSSTGVISGQPDTGTSAGSPYAVTVEVKEQGTTLSDTRSYTLEVTNAATTTQLTLAAPTDLTVTEGKPFTKTFSVTYTGTPDLLTYTISGLPGGVNYNNSTGEITSPATESGTFPIDIEVTDGAERDTGSFALTVLPASTPPPPQTSYTITATAGEGGRISPSGSVTVAESAYQVFTIAPSSGHYIYDVVVDGAGVGAVSSYLFADVRADHTITASFIKDGATGPSSIPNSGSRSSDGSSSGGSTYTPPPKATLPASVFSWDGVRTLTINYDNITPLGLLSVWWDGQLLTRGTHYGVYQGSVIIRFSKDFMAGQSSDDHTVRVEFLNHIGEITVTVGGEPGLADEGYDDLFVDTYNPNTGGYPDSAMGATDNPNTGDQCGIWLALLLGSIGGLSLVMGRKQG